MDRCSFRCCQFLSLGEHEVSGLMPVLRRHRLLRRQEFLLYGVEVAGEPFVDDRAESLASLG